MQVKLTFNDDILPIVAAVQEKYKDCSYLLFDAVTIMLRGSGRYITPKDPKQKDFIILKSIIDDSQKDVLTKKSDETGTICLDYVVFTKCFRSITITDNKDDHTEKI